MKFLKDDRANGGASFLVIVFLLMFILINIVPLVEQLYNEIFVVIAYTKTLDTMQHTGGLTAAIENNTLDMLEAAGFDRGNITITGTIAPVDYGDYIGVTIEYSDSIKRYQYNGNFSITAVNEVKNYEMSGNTISYYYDNND